VGEAHNTFSATPSLSFPRKRESRKETWIPRRGGG